MDTIKNYNEFVFENSKANAKRKSAISICLSKVKEKYGNDMATFVKSMKKSGAQDELKELIDKTLEPYVQSVQNQGILQSGHTLDISYDELVRGCICWIYLQKKIAMEKEFLKDKEKDKK